jgi:molybdate transport system substrate-binding protein
LSNNILTFLILLTMTLSACTPAASPAGAPQPAAPETKTLTVLAAASLTAPFKDLGNIFEAAHPGVKVEFSFAGSQQLAQQLAQGAPADVFASASKKSMDAAVGARRIEKDSSKIFAENLLTIAIPTANTAGLNEMKDLAKPGIKIVLGAKEVPCGQYALDSFDKAVKDPAYGAAFKEQVLKNVVSYEDNVKSIVTKVALGEADAGIVYVSDLAGDAARKASSIEIPAALNTLANYPLAAISDSRNPELAKAFVDLVRSKEGQDSLAKYSFIPGTK